MNIFYTIGKSQKPQVIQVLNSLNIQNKPLTQIDKMICRGVPGLSVDYLIQQKNSYITIYIENSAKKLVGIVIFSTNKKVVKIYVLCTPSSSGYGTKLLDLVKEFAKRIGSNKIELEAIQSAVGFYSKKEFLPTGKSIIRNINVNSASSDSSSSSDSSATASKAVNYIEMEYTIKKKSTLKREPTKTLFSLQRANSYNNGKRKSSRITAKLRHTL